MAGRRGGNQLEEGAFALVGSRLIRQMRQVTARLHDAGTARDVAGNRTLFFDDYLCLLLLYFFTPAIDSLRALQQVSDWKQTQRRLGIRRTSLGSLHEAARVFDAALVEPIFQELVGQLIPLKTGREADALKGLIAVDGSVFRAMTRMAWALWQDADHRGVKLHRHFDVLKGGPCQLAVTPAACSEPAQLSAMLQRDRLYVLDRGDASFELFRDILAAGSSLVARVKDDIAVHGQEERPLDEAAREAGVVRDVILKRLGAGKHKDVVGRAMRLVIVETTDREGKRTALWLVTDRLDLAADLVALADRHRWTIELFFRWLKCILGARHLIAENPNGVLLQMYAAMIVCLLTQLRTGRKPTKRTFEAMQFYLLGWISDEELDQHLAGLEKLASPDSTHGFDPAAVALHAARNTTHAARNTTHAARNTTLPRLKPDSMARAPPRRRAFPTSKPTATMACRTELPKTGERGPERMSKRIRRTHHPSAAQYVHSTPQLQVVMNHVVRSLLSSGNCGKPRQSITLPGRYIAPATRNV
jgi:hypothetical protein